MYVILLLRDPLSQFFMMCLIPIALHSLLSNKHIVASCSSLAILAPRFLCLIKDNQWRGAVVLYNNPGRVSWVRATFSRCCQGPNDGINEKTTGINIDATLLSESSFAVTRCCTLNESSFGEDISPIHYQVSDTSTMAIFIVLKIYAN